MTGPPVGRHWDATHLDDDRPGGECGAVTVEAAIAIAGLTLVLALVLGGLAAMIDQVRCVDAAREAARLVARGEPERARTVAGEIAPRGADLRINVDGDAITVEVHADAASGFLPGVRLRAEAYAVAEPGLLEDGLGAEVAAIEVPIPREAAAATSAINDSVAGVRPRQASDSWCSWLDRVRSDGVRVATWTASATAYADSRTVILSEVPGAVRGVMGGAKTYTDSDSGGGPHRTCSEREGGR